MASSVPSTRAPTYDDRVPRAFIEKIEIDAPNYLDCIRQGLDHIGFGRSISLGAAVFLKPNLTFPTYRPGVMTSPAAVEAAIVALKDYSVEIWLGDSDSGGYNPFPMERVYEETGISDLAKRFGVKVVNLSRLPRVSVPLGSSRIFDIDLPRLLTEEIDQLITMPVPKVHLNTGVSLTFKNQWGCIPDPRDRLRLHPYFSEVVVSLNRAVKATTAIIDGRYGLNRSGPMLGDPVPLGWICVAEDLGTGAAVGLKLMKLDITDIPHKAYAKSLGLIPHLDDVELNRPLEGLEGPSFYMRRKITDYPGLIAFRSPKIAHLAYFSRFAGVLHKLLYLFRKPFYDYDAARRDQAEATWRPPRDQP